MQACFDYFKKVKMNAEVKYPAVPSYKIGSR